MYTRSAAFDAAIINSHKIATKVEVYSNDSLLSDVSLSVVDGNITVDDVAIHRKATLTLVDPTGTLTPATASDMLSPLGNEIKLYRGLTYADGTTELLAQGVYGISDVRIDDSGAKFQIGLTCFDRARKIQRARFPTEYIVASGTNYGEAIQALLTDRYSLIDFNFPIVALTTPQLVFEAGSDPWKAAQDMAASVGYDLYFDPNGVCIMVPITLSGSPVWTYAEGSQAMILYVNRRLNDEKTYNHVIVTGESTGTDAPVRGEAYDNNPSSPTYYLGAYGDVVTFEASSFIRTVEQANAAAQRKLSKTLGLIEMLEFFSIVHPAHETGDLVQITRSDSKVNNVYTLGKITIPMVHDRPLIATARERILT